MAIPRYQYPGYSAVLSRWGRFEESALTTDPGETRYDQWGSYLSRIIRYATLWAHFEGNVYRRIHRSAARYKENYGLYEFTRSIFNPTYELVEFYATHLIGGELDPEAGDGKQRPSAVPIVIPADNPRADDIRRSLALLWRESNWAINKETYSRFGAALGDVFLFAEDDAARRRIRVRVVHPKTVESVDLDPYGNVRGYVIREWRRDPRDLTGNPFAPDVLYTERCTKVGQAVHFETSIGENEEPWDWSYDPDVPGSVRRSEWTEDYGFVPLVKVQHMDLGLCWGWAAVFASLSLVHEIDDGVSKLDDQIRKIVENPRMLTGTAAPGTTTLDASGTNTVAATNALQAPWPSEDDGDREAPRSDVPVFYNSNDKADVKSMLGTLDIAAASEHFQTIVKRLERRHPELSDDRGTAAGAASGRALRVYREAKEKIVRARRIGYDEGQVRVFKMALTMGGMKGYDGYPFDAESYARGDLDFAIDSQRPVFSDDDGDRIEMAQAFGDALTKMRAAKLPMKAALRRLGVSDEEIGEIINEMAAEDRKTVQAAQARQVATFGGPADVGAGMGVNGANGGGANGNGNGNATPAPSRPGMPGAGAGAVAANGPAAG